MSWKALTAMWATLIALHLDWMKQQLAVELAASMHDTQKGVCMQAF